MGFERTLSLVEEEVLKDTQTQNKRKLVERGICSLNLDVGDHA